MNNSQASPSQSEVVKGITDMITQPAFLQMWATLSPEKQQGINMIIQSTLSAAASGQQSALGSMLPLMMMQGQQGKSGDSIGVKDLAEMFNAGVAAAKGNSSPSQSPIEVIDSVVSLLKPLQEQANEATRRAFQQQIDALKASQPQSKGIKENGLGAV